MNLDPSKLEKTQVIMFNSTFCSKCMYNRNLWNDVTKGKPELIEINISDKSNREILEKFKPRFVPTIVVVDQSRSIYTYEGIINSKIIRSIVKMHTHLSQH